MIAAFSRKVEASNMLRSGIASRSAQCKKVKQVKRLNDLAQDAWLKTAHPFFGQQCRKSPLRKGNQTRILPHNQVWPEELLSKAYDITCFGSLRSHITFETTFEAIPLLKYFGKRQT